MVQPEYMFYSTLQNGKELLSYDDAEAAKGMECDPPCICSICTEEKWWCKV